MRRPMFSLSAFCVSLVTFVFIQQDRDRIQGEWQFHSVEYSYTPWLAKAVQGSVVTLRTGEILPKEKTLVPGKLSYALNPGKKPKWIDITLVTVDKQEIIMLGVD